MTDRLTSGTPRYPALLVGVGGTGITTLRFLKAVALYGGDKSLKEMLESGRLQLLGIDTDRGSNLREREVDRNLLPRGEGFAGRESLPFRTLPPLDDFIHVPADDITRALMAVRRSVRELDAAERYEQNEPDAVIHREIAEWFPKPVGDQEDEIGYGQSRLAGAAQWRPLGRVGVFVKSGDIYERLARMHQEIAGAIANDTEQTQPVRAYVIGSLAGGTGSGFFWDIGFMLRRLSEKLLVHAGLLLPDVFVELDRANRVMPNTYAALKELAHLKNWTVDDHMAVKYPNGIRFEAYPGGATAFDKVYLYRDFKPGEEVADYLKARVDVTCLRIAQNILTQLRHDIHLEIDVGANNESGDGTQLRSEQTARHVFSTSGATEYSWDTLSTVIDRSISRSYALVHQWLGNGEQAQWRVSHGDFTHTLYGNGKAADTSLGYENWLGHFVDRHGTWLAGENLGVEERDKKLTLSRKGLSNWLRRLDEVASNLRELLDNGEADPDLEAFYTEAVPEPIREFWAKSPTHGVEKKFLPPPELIFDQTVEDIVEGLSRRLNELAERIDDEGLLISEDDLTEIGNCIDFVDEELEEWHPLGDRGIGRPDTLLEHLQEYVSPPVGLSRKIFARLGDTLENVETKLHGVGPYGATGLGPVAAELMLDLFAWLTDALSKVGHSYGRPEAILALRRRLKVNGLSGRFSKLLEAHEKSLDRRSRCKDELRRERHYWPKEGEEALEEDDEILARSVLPALEALAKDIGNEHLLARHANSLAEYWEQRRERFPWELDETMGNSAWWRRLLAGVAADLDPAKPGRALFDPALLWGQALNREGQWPLEPKHCHLHGDMRFIDRVHIWQTLLSLGIGYTLGEPEGALARIGGSGGLSLRLRQCHSNVMAVGSLTNPIAKRNLVLVKTRDEFEFHGQDLGEKGEKALDRAFSNAAQAEFGVVPRISNRYSGLPVIYFEELYRGAAEIANIERYREAYLSIPEERREFFHVFRNVANLPDIVTSTVPPHAVYCGNEDCSHDIRYLPKTALICPGCKQPIWNRCGNNHCPENDLLDRFRRDNGGKQPEHYPHQCPECHNELKTYWWYCDDRDHKNYPIPADKIQCPRCLSEYQNGVRAHHDVRWRPDKRQIECPGCGSLPGLKRAERVMVPEDLKKYFSDGVNGHDSTVFAKLVKQSSLMEHVCVQQKHTHYLFPTCTEEDEEGHMHHLFRNHDGHFVCPQHPDKQFYECHHCGYPIDKDDPKLAGHGRTRCPRCMRELRVCDYCSEDEGKLYEPHTSGRTGLDHCPRCSNNMEPQEDTRTLSLSNDFERSGFCRNILNCRAASDFWHTASDYERGSCKVCRDESGQLLDRADIVEHVQRCPVCLSLFGLPKEPNSGSGLGIERYSAEMLAHHFANLPSGKFRFGDPCVVCATRPPGILFWMVKRGFFKQSGVLDPTKLEENLSRIMDRYSDDTQPLPDISPVQFLDLLEMLKGERNNQRVLRELRKKPLFIKHWDDIQLIRTNLLPLFEPKLLSGVSFNKRLKAICELHEQDLLREREEVSFKAE